MEIAEFREGIKPGKIIAVEGRQFKVLQAIKFRLDDGSFYFKCFLSGERVIAEDSEMNVYIFVKPLTTGFSEPMPMELKFDNKNFKFLYEAHAVAEEVRGDKAFEQGETERFWDYKSEDGSYLSLGINEKTGKKADFYGKIVKTKDVEIV